MSHQPRDSFDLAVIGGGILGLACARAHARSGRRVVVLEMAPGRGASWAAAGMLSPWSEHPADPEGLEARERSLSLFPAWVEAIGAESGLRIDFARCGSLAVTPPGTALAAALADIQARIPGFHRLSPEELRAEAPILDREVGGGALLPEEGYVEPRSLMAALGDACGRAGAVKHELPALGLIESGGRVEGVTTPIGPIRAGTVLNAAGAWAGAFLPGGGGIRPVRGQLVTLRPPAGAIRLGRVVQSPEVYLVPRADGAVLVGSTSEEVGFAATTTAAGIRGLLERAEALAPSLADWSIDSAWAGLRPYREGGLFVGRDPERRGLVHAIGPYRHGILLAPLIAEQSCKETER